MGYRSDEKEYYESQTQRRVLYIPNLSIFLSKLNDQILKLPHENQDPTSNYPTGCTNDDIEMSISRGVENLYIILAPARAMLSDDKDSIITFEPEDEDAYNKKSIFNKAMEKLEWCYLLMEEADWLNDRLVNENLPGDEDTYEFGGISDEPETTKRTMPPSLPVADEKTVGQMEEENQ